MRPRLNPARRGRNRKEGEEVREERRSNKRCDYVIVLGKREAKEGGEGFKGVNKDYF